VNNLNSVLLEGIIKGPVSREEVGKIRRFSFVLSSLHLIRDGERAGTWETLVKVVLRGKAGEAALKQAKDGRGVRIVGWLAGTEQSGGLYIEAEHIEYKPEPKKEGTA
jgi:hypothetical protein